MKAETFWSAYKWWLIAALAILAVAVVITVVAVQPSEKTPVAPTMGATPTYNVKDYGAKNDGTGIQDAAILKACTAAKGAIVYFPGGNYSVSKAFRLPYGTVTRGDKAKQAYLMVIMPQADGTVSWKFTWIKP